MKSAVLYQTVKHAGSTATATKNNQSMMLEWKAKKVGAAELVYALYYSGAVDNDRCTVYELAKQCGELFQIQIADTLQGSTSTYNDAYCNPRGSL